MRNKRMQSALALFNEGYAIFPIAENTKIPKVRWSTDWSVTEDQVREYWANYPRDNIGVNCEESAVLIVDLDGVRGISEFQELWDGHEDVPYAKYTRWSTTPNGGQHVWFDAPDDLPLHNTASKLRPKVDTRGAGGMIVAPGSDIDGRYYELQNERMPASLPAWLLAALRQQEVPLRARLPVDPQPWTYIYSLMMLQQVSMRVAQALPGLAQQGAVQGGAADAGRARPAGRGEDRGRAADRGRAERAARVRVTQGHPVWGSDVS